MQDFAQIKNINMYTYKAKVNRIIDGDTVNLTIDLGFRLTYTANCRLAGINAPEMNTEDGKASKIALLLLLVLGNEYTIQSNGLDKYGRPIVTILKADTTINQMMLDSKYAKPY
jgi:micrococcal nuclease